MTIDKAIKNLTTIETKLLDLGWAESKDSIKLGIEALKGLQALRRGRGRSLAELLPGETTQ